MELHGLGEEREALSVESTHTNLHATTVENSSMVYDELGVNLTDHPDGRVHIGAGGGCA
jgi:hypothetical protein